MTSEEMFYYMLYGNSKKSVKDFVEDPFETADKEDPGNEETDENQQKNRAKFSDAHAV